MKLRKLLPIVFLAVAGLSACGDKTVYDVNIDNADAISAEWHVGDADRVLSVSATKNGEAVNATQLLNSEIFVTSSNEEVLTTLGFVLKPVAAGQVTVKVEYHSAKVELELNVRPVRTCIDKYGTVHAGTEADPLDYADALTIGAAMKAAAKSTDEDNIYIKGVVKYWYHFPGERAANDNATSWFIEGAGTETRATELFEMYKVTKEGGATLTDADIWPGAEVLIYGQIGYYNDQLETTKGTFVRVTGGAARVAPETKQVNVNTKNTGALAVGKALQDGDTTWDKYEVTGYTVNFLGSSGSGENKVYNYMIADAKDETAAAKQFEIYGTKNELKFNAKVKATCRIKNYHGTIETNMLESVEVLEEGVDWTEYKEPATIEDKGIADLFADESGNYKKAYQVTATIYKWDNNGKEAEAPTKYGSFYAKVAGDETVYYIYGLSVTNTALKWEVYANKYSFTNPQDFLTKDATKDLKMGDEITMKLVRADYTKTNSDGTTTVTKEAVGILIPPAAPVALTADAALTPASIMGYAGAQVAYSADEKTAEISGATFAAKGCGVYMNNSDKTKCNGIQFRYNNANTGTSMVYNKTPITNMATIVLEWSALMDISKKNDGSYQVENLKIEFATAASFAEDKLVQAASTVTFTTDAKTQTVTVPAGATFFRISSNNKGAVYLDSITVTKAAA